MKFRKLMRYSLIAAILFPALYSLQSALLDRSAESVSASKYAQGIAYLHARAVVGKSLDRFIPAADAAYTLCKETISDSSTDSSMACSQTAMLKRYGYEVENRDQVKNELFFAKSHGVCPVARRPLCENVSWFTWLTLYAGRCSCNWGSLLG